MLITCFVSRLAGLAGIRFCWIDTMWSLWRQWMALGYLRSLSGIPFSLRLRIDGNVPSRTPLEVGNLWYRLSRKKLGFFFWKDVSKSLAGYCSLLINAVSQSLFPYLSVRSTRILGILLPIVYYILRRRDQCGMITFCHLPALVFRPRPRGNLCLAQVPLHSQRSSRGTHPQV